MAMARTLMDRKLEGRRTSSKLPELVELVMAKPLVSAGMVAKTLDVTPQAARRIVLELGLRSYPPPNVTVEWNSRFQHEFFFAKSSRQSKTGSGYGSA